LFIIEGIHCDRIALSFQEILGLARNHCGYKNETVPREPPIIVTEYLSTKLSSIMYLNYIWEAVMQTNVSVSGSVYFERQNFLGYFWLGRGLAWLPMT
jgi:hypothetical protein